MALTIAIEGTGVIANCDALSDSAGGTWTEEGGGTISLSEDVFLSGTASIGAKYASKSGFHQYDLGSGNELNFNSGGSELGQMLYMWVSMTALGTLDTLSNYGLCIRLSSSEPGTTNYIDYLIAGSDDKNGWTGGFKCFVIDPTKTPSRVSGTQSSIIGSVRTVGIWIDCSSSARADSLFVDQIAVGKGLRIMGTSTQGWKDVVDYCTNYSSRAWGMMQEREGIYYAYGKIWIGGTGQTADVEFADSGRIIQWGTSEYYNGSAWVSSMDSDLGGIYLLDITSYHTKFTDGILVGTDNGRAGSQFIAYPGSNATIGMTCSGDVNSFFKLYGTTLKNFAPTVSSDFSFANTQNSLSAVYGVNFVSCGVLYSTDDVPLRNCSFQNCTDTKGALHYANTWYNLEDCSFIACSRALYMTSDFNDPFTLTNLTFSGNTYDVNNVSGNTIEVNNVGSNASTYTGSLVTFTTNVTIEVKNVISGSAVRVSTVDGNGDESTNIINQIASGTSVSTTVNYSGLDYTNVVVIVRSSSGTTKYLPYRASDTISSSGLSHSANQVEDTIAN